MKPKKTWVIVANGEIVRLFDLPVRTGPLAPLDDHVWNAPETNDYADTQGMSHSSVGPAQRRLSPRTEPEDRALDEFARVISDKLADALQSGSFEQLVIVAAPRLMGFLRDHLSDAVRATIWVEIDKDFTRMPLDKLNNLLVQHLYS